MSRAAAVGGVSTATVSILTKILSLIKLLQTNCYNIFPNIIVPQEDAEEFSETDIEAITETANLPDPFRLVYMIDK